MIYHVYFHNPKTNQPHVFRTDDLVSLIRETGHLQLKSVRGRRMK